MIIRRALSLGIVGICAAALYYVSRFWDFRLWGREGLFGLDALPPQGGLVARWLRGSDLAPFELLIWVAGVFFVLTLLQKLFDMFTPADPAHERENDDD